MPGTASSTPPLRDRLAAWWREPRLNGWTLATLAGLLFLRRPDALVSPQLWAEDGSVFLLGQDAHGLAAVLQPYMGYLHTLPRLTAWAADLILDVAWWPAFYNAVAFAVWLGVLARLFSPRLNLPHRPWLAAGVLLAVQTPEILLNLTNAQWAGALLLLQQTLIARPAGRGERAADLALVALFGLTGPFIIPLLPSSPGAGGATATGTTSRCSLSPCFAPRSKAPASTRPRSPSNTSMRRSTPPRPPSRSPAASSSGRCLDQPPPATFPRSFRSGSARWRSAS